MQDKDKKHSDRGGSHKGVPAKTGINEHAAPEKTIKEHKEVGIGLPVSSEEMERLKENARKLDR